MFSLKSVFDVKLLAFLFLISPNAVSSQIIITSDDILGLIGDTATLEDDTTGSITVNVGVASNTCQTWDFTTIDIQDPFFLTQEFLEPQGTTFDSNFPGSNFLINKNDATGTLARNFGLTVEQISFYTYFDVTSTNFSGIGGGIVTQNPDFTFVYSEIDEDSPMPYSLGKNWNSMIVETIGDTNSTANVFTTLAENSIDACGIVRIPLGDFDCLRLRTDLEVTFERYEDGQVKRDTSLSGINYTWLSKENYVVAQIGSQANETDPGFTNARDFKRLFSFIVSVEDPAAEIPTDFELSQNYPNPFNPETVIKYKILQNGEVELAIFNLLGQKVRVLVNEVHVAGSYEVRWNGTDDLGNLLSSGVYVYRLKAGDVIRTNKMLLLR